MDGTEITIGKYFVLLKHQKWHPKENNSCYNYQLTKVQNMVNDQLWYLSKYHGINYG